MELIEYDRYFMIAPGVVAQRFVYEGEVEPRYAALPNAEAKRFLDQRAREQKLPER